MPKRLGAVVVVAVAVAVAGLLWQGPAAQARPNCDVPTPPPVCGGGGGGGEDPPAPPPPAPTAPRIGGLGHLTLPAMTVWLSRVSGAGPAATRAMIQRSPSASGPWTTVYDSSVDLRDGGPTGNTVRTDIEHTLPFTQWCFKGRLANSTSWSPWSVVKCVGLAPKVTQVTVTPLTGGQAIVGWTDNAESDPYAVVEVTGRASAPYDLVPGHSGTGPTQYLVKGLTPGGQHCIRVASRVMSIWSVSYNGDAPNEAMWPALNPSDWVCFTDWPPV